LGGRGLKVNVKHCELETGFGAEPDVELTKTDKGWEAKITTALDLYITVNFELEEK
jgi:hypothetical protein